MRVLRFVLLVGLLLFIAYTRFATHSSPLLSTPAGPPLQSQVDDGVPAKAHQVLDYVRRTGEAPEGYVGGRVFQNREHRLPAGGDYREFDVDPHNGGRNAERLIVEWNTKRAWYTSDHYQTFTPLP